MSKRLILAAVLCAGTLSASAHSARAGVLEKIEQKLSNIQAEVSTLKQGIRRPNTIGKVETDDLTNRRLIDAQVNFGIGNYDDAAVMLYDFVEKHPTHHSWDEALYYLAESLFQKGDFLASRSYFIRLADERGTQSRFYQQGLERLIELTLKLDDSKGVEKWLSALDQVPQNDLRASVPYVRGKYSYFLGEFDDSLKHFALVPKNSKYYLQTQYFVGVNYVAKGDIAKAMDTYQTLLRQKAKGNEHKRVLELAQMAMGRLFYERDQPSKSVDAYLRISRHSDLFDEALYEVAWVYVKNKEFNKALRALELLALADPTSEKMPDVRILEGNLRIRKARKIAENGKGNSKEQYEKATKVFEDTGNTFRESHVRLKEIMANRQDASAFMSQITGRNSETFDTTSTLPEVAASWLRQQPEVARVVSVESDLGQIEAEIKEGEKNITRLESAINTASKVNIFPYLAKKRFRSTEILEETFLIRSQLATHERVIVNKYMTTVEKAELGALLAKRKQLEKQLKAIPDSDKSEDERVRLARNRYTTMEERAAEVATLIELTEAQLVALEQYVRDQNEEIKTEELETIHKELEATRADVKMMRADLKVILADSVMGKDRAGTSDANAGKRISVRGQLQIALDTEHSFMARLSTKMNGSDKSKMQRISNLSEQSRGATGNLDEMNKTIESIVDGALREVRAALDEEKAQLAAYKGEFSNYEVESRGLGGEVLALSFQNVTGKFYDILARTDVGIVDVAWSLKEASETMLKRLTLDQARERRTLDSNFSDIIREIREDEAQRLFDQAAGTE